MAQSKHAAPARKHSILPILLILIILLLVAAAAAYILLSRSGKFDKIPVSAQAEQPRITLLDTGWADELTAKDAAGMREQINAALSSAVQYAGSAQAAIAVSPTNSKGEAIFIDRTKELTSAAALESGDTLLHRYDALYTLLNAAAEEGIPVYLLADDAAAAPAWLTALCERYGLSVLSANEDACTDSLGNSYLVMDNAAPGLTACAWQQSAEEYAGIALGTLAELEAAPEEAELLDSYLGDALPDLTQYWNGKEISKTLAVTYPLKNGTTVNNTSLFLMGTSDPDQPLTLNGEEVARYGTQGVWGVLVTLQQGANSFTLAQGSNTVDYTVSYQPLVGKAYTIKNDSSAGTEAIGKKIRVTEAIASALASPSDASSIHETLYRGATATITGVTTWVNGTKRTHAYQLSTGDYIRSGNAEVITAKDAAFTGCTVTEDADSNCTVLTFTGSGTPAVYRTRQDNTLSLHFLSASYTGDLPQSSRFTAALTEESDGFTLTFTFAEDDPLWGWAVNYDTDNSATTLWFKHTPHLSGDSAAPLQGVTVMLDAGHGDDADGAMGSAGLTAPEEKELNLSAVMAAKYRLEQLGATVLLTRDTDTDPTLGDRVTAMNEQHPDLFISVHHNSVELTSDVNQASGTEAYWFFGAGQELAQTLAQNVADATGRSVHLTRYGYYYVTRSEICPATLLELGFVTNPAEYEDCADIATLWKEGTAIADTIYTLIAQNG